MDHIIKETIKTSAISTEKLAVPWQTLLSAEEMYVCYDYISDDKEEQ